MGIVPVPSQHPKDVPFVSEFWWVPRKQQILAIVQISSLQNHKLQRHSPGIDTLFETILQCVPRYTATRLVVNIYSPLEVGPLNAATGGMGDRCNRHLI